MHDAEWVSGHELTKQLYRIPSDVATLVFKTSSSKLCRCLTAFGELLFQFTQLHVHLNVSATAVGVSIQKSLFQDVKEAIDLRFRVLVALLLLAQIRY